MNFSLPVFEVKLCTNHLSYIFLAKAQVCPLKLIFNQSGFMQNNYSEAYSIGSSGKKRSAQKLEGSSEVHQLRKKSFGG
jgi:hypothetical protein